MSGLEYIGSKISLVSLSDIRYVGILHNINSLEATVALQHVQSFGTEGRKSNPNEEISPSDNVFDYVVFRGSDIKDLQVFEAPSSYKSESTVNQQVTYDTMKTSTSRYHVPQQNTAYMPPPATKYYWQSSSTVPYHTSNTQPQYTIVPQAQHLRMPVLENYHQKTNSYPVTTQQEKTVANSPRDEQFITNEPQEKQEVTLENSQDKVAKVEENEDIMVNSLARQVSELDITTNHLTKTTQERVHKQQQQQQQKKSAKGVTKKQSSTPTANNEKSEDTQVNANVQPSSVTKSHHRRRRSTGTNKNNNGLTVPKSDFDFARSNAKFDKNGIVAEKEGVKTPEQSEFYNKEKSFFDNFSSEAKEYGNGNREGKNQGERTLNLVTFGQTSIDGVKQGNRRRRHRGRGGKGHGFAIKNSTANETTPRAIKEVA